MQALALNEFAKQLEQMEEQFKNRNDEDGIVSNGYNMVKVLLDAGVSNQEIEKAIAEQKQMVKELKNALNGKGDLTFEEVYKKWTGVDYNPEKIIEHINVKSQYEFAASNIASAQKMSNDIKNAKNLKEVFNIFVENEKVQNILKNAGIMSNIAQNSIILHFLNKIKNNDSINLNTIEPIYLRASQAEIERNKKLQGENNG